MTAEERAEVYRAALERLVEALDDQESFNAVTPALRHAREVLRGES